MRYSKHYQYIADRYAREFDYAAASYMGAYKDNLVFEPIYRDSLPRTVGLPSVILINEKKGIDEVRGVITFTILRDTHRRDLVKGRSLYRMYEAMSDAEDVSDEEREYASMIVGACDDEGYESLIDKRTMFIYLEIADRLNMKVELKSEAGEYYIELTEK